MLEALRIHLDGVILGSVVDLGKILKTYIFIKVRFAFFQLLLNQLHGLVRCMHSAILILDYIGLSAEFIQQV